MLLSIDLKHNKSFKNSYKPLNRLLYSHPEFLFMGFEINDRYDEERLKIHEDLCPLYIKHHKTDQRFYGIIIGEYYNTVDFDKVIAEIKSPPYNKLYNNNVVITEKPLHNKNIDINLFFCNNDIPFYQRFSDIKTYIFFN